MYNSSQEVPMNRITSIVARSFWKSIGVVVLVLSGLVTVPVVAQQRCLTNQIILNTGYDPATGRTLPVSNPSLPPGSPGWDVPDPYWIVIQDPLPGTIEPRPASVIAKHPAWDGPLPGSQWIAVYNDYRNNTNGVYVFRRCFCIQDSGFFVVSLQALADDIIDSILVCGRKLTNRTPDYTHYWFKMPPREYRDTLFLTPGGCCIEVYVRNTHQVAFGLNIAGSVTPLWGSLLADTCCWANTGWIRGQKYHDLNCNGKIDPGEPVLSGWTIQATGAGTYTTTTGIDGWYNLAVPPGTYTVSEQLQPGYTGAPGASGPYTVTVGPGQVAQRNFLNCTAPPPCDTIGQIHLDSACCQFTIPIFQPSGVPGISQIQWQLSGGTMESITTFPCSASPPIGTPTNGTITFTPPCSANPLNLQMEVTPTTASGVVTLYLTIYHGPNKVCRETVRLHCSRAPLTKCDSLSVKPFVWPGLNLSGRTFTIYNQKVPPSPIKEVLISFTPPPCVSSSAPLGDWNGGGLVVDGQNRPWGVGNSGTPKYSQISMDCDTTVPPPAPQGAAASNYVQFNLGIDYTCNWTGTVTFTVIHCDGDTCRLSYNWCAKQNPIECLIVNPTPIDISPILITRRLIASQTGIRDSAHAIGFFIVRLDSSMIGRARLLSTGVKLTKADAARSIEGIRHIDDNAILATVGDARNDERVPNEYTITPLFECERCDSVPYVIELYDKDANPLDQIRMKAAQVVSGLGSQLVQPSREGVLQITPNPGGESVTLRFVALYPGAVSLEIVDALGRTVFTWSDYLDSAGPQEIGMSTERLATGRYQVRLRLPEGTVLTAPLVVVR
jgi:hypothetical protein